jgi:hypothetical protein
MTSSQSGPPDTPVVPCSVWFGPVVTAAEERAFIEHLVSEHGVAVCCWPRDAVRVEHLAAAGVPRLLLVGVETIPPAPAPHQWWVRRTASNAEIHEALVGLCSQPAETRRSA